MKGSAIVRPEKSLAAKKVSERGTVAEFRERQTAKQRTRASCEPLVNGDDRTVVLLDLFFSAGHRRDESYVEVGLDGHGRQSRTGSDHAFMRVPTCHSATSVKIRNRLSATRLTAPESPDSANR